MNIPKELKYTKEHEWIRIEGDEAVVGITDFAQGELGDIVRIVPCRPRSKKKRHALKDIIRKAPKLDLSGD